MGIYRTSREQQAKGNVQGYYCAQAMVYVSKIMYKEEVKQY